MTATVIDFPHRTRTNAPATHRQNQATARAAAPSPIHELLRLAVVAYRAGSMRTVGTVANRHHLEVAYAYLHAVAVVVEKPGVELELTRLLAAGVFDIRRLVFTAHNWDGPDAA
ncbi:hypothetical protein V6N00_12465 [Tersicoccus sp. MR15.9]|uniref:hypothetical protein n=1 Tax=Tersicoccus mangrovi TaxID=3121635 RepID=UPI002FE63BB1